MPLNVAVSVTLILHRRSTRLKLIQRLVPELVVQNQSVPVLAPTQMHYKFNYSASQLCDLSTGQRQQDAWFSAKQ